MERGEVYFQKKLVSLPINAWQWFKVVSNGYSDKLSHGEVLESTMSCDDVNW